MSCLRVAGDKCGLCDGLGIEEVTIRVQGVPQTIERTCGRCGGEGVLVSA